MVILPLVITHGLELNLLSPFFFNFFHVEYLQAVL